MIDVSEGMGQGGLMMVKAEINTLVGQMSLDPNIQKHVQVGLIKYSDKAEVEISYFYSRNTIITGCF